MQDPDVYCKQMQDPDVYCMVRFVIPPELHTGSIWKKTTHLMFLFLTTMRQLFLQQDNMNKILFVMSDYD
jgi:hypothetical protein